MSAPADDEPMDEFAENDPNRTDAAPSTAWWTERVNSTNAGSRARRRATGPVPLPPVPKPADVAQGDRTRYFLSCFEPGGEFEAVIVAVTDGARRRYFTSNDGTSLTEVDELSFEQRRKSGTRSMLEIDERELRRLEDELDFTRALQGRDPIAEAEAARLEEQARETTVVPVGAVDAASVPAATGDQKKEEPMTFDENDELLAAWLSQLDDTAIPHRSRTGEQPEVEAPADDAATASAQPPAEPVAAPAPAAPAPAPASPAFGDDDFDAAGAADDASERAEHDGADAAAHAADRSDDGYTDVATQYLDMASVLDAARGFDATPSAAPTDFDPAAFAAAVQPDEDADDAVHESTERPDDAQHVGAEADHASPNGRAHGVPAPTEGAEPSSPTEPEQPAAADPAPASQPPAPWPTTQSDHWSAPSAPPAAPAAFPAPPAGPAFPTPPAAAAAFPVPIADAEEAPTGPMRTRRSYTQPGAPEARRDAGHGAHGHHAAPAPGPVPQPHWTVAAPPASHHAGPSYAAPVGGAASAVHLSGAEGLVQVSLAKGIAFVAHRGRLDKSGLPYIDHPGRVAERFDPEHDPVAAASAWLHDVLEDTPITARELLEAGMMPDIVEVVELLTRRPEVSADEYYAAIRRHPVARRVKLADIDDNTAPWRLRRLDFAMQHRLAEKYRHARMALGAE
ncbi:hypothetical protein [Agromyces sp. SYSU T0242]|uniref:hypothetical protein n=1 Tax=Agromyces litoreus TaxID=3158561 RepID=UPI0033984055